MSILLEIVIVLNIVFLTLPSDTSPLLKVLLITAIGVLVSIVLVQEDRLKYRVKDLEKKYNHISSAVNKLNKED